MDSIKLQGGFTLLEVLVATFILAVGIAASINVLGFSANALQYAEKKQFAMLTAHNQLLMQTLEPIQLEGYTLNGGYKFRWKVNKYPTSDPLIYRIEIDVFDYDEEVSLAHIKSFKGEGR